MFLRQVWDHLELPPPTPIQNSIAWFLQHGPDRLIIMAFRGIGKSWITCAYVAWLLFLNPQLKILVVSANEKLAAAFIRQLRDDLIEEMPLLQHLRPKPGKLDAADGFIVGPAKGSKEPSVRAAGITGQITGGRADVIVPDDIEIPKNSHTHLLRERISELVKEFDAVLKPGGMVRYLGTPQTEQSLYNRLVSRGYVPRIWTAEVPDKPELYGDRLAPFVRKAIDAGTPAHTPLEPTRFDEEELAKRKISYGTSGYSLQFMLDTNPSDADKHPLKTRDLIVADVDPEVGWVKLVWGSQNVIQNLPSGGFDGDYYVNPAWQSEEMVPFQGTVCAIDPSGRGQDETSYAILRYLSGMLYLVDIGGFKDGFGEDTLKSIATAMVRHRVNYWIAEENYGGGMFAELLKPVIAKVAEQARLDPNSPDPKARPAKFDDEFNGWSSTQKEQRILDTLQPVFSSHRLVIDRRVIEADLKIQGDLTRYSLIQQMTRMARLKGCLPNEDRLEALSMACSYWTERMARDKDKALQDHKAALLDSELARFMKNAITLGQRSLNQPNSDHRWNRR